MEKLPILSKQVTDKCQLFTSHCIGNYVHKTNSFADDMLAEIPKKGKRFCPHIDAGQLSALNSFLGTWLLHKILDACRYSAIGVIAERSDKQKVHGKKGKNTWTRGESHEEFYRRQYWQERPWLVMQDY